MASIFTIGFTKSSARHFLGRLRAPGVREVVDVRLSNTSHLAGFARADELAWFLETMGIGYRHAPELAPTEEMLGAYRAKKIGWDDYAARFNTLISERHVERLYPASSLAGACLLCSEAMPHHCHRRLVAEYVTAAAPAAPPVRHLRGVRAPRPPPRRGRACRGRAPRARRRRRGCRRGPRTSGR